MKIIEAKKFSNFVEYSAIFFTNDGIIIDCLTSSAIMNFQAMAEKLKMKIDVAYLDETMLIVLCQDLIELDQSFKNQFHIHPTKDFLTQIDNKTQQQILRAVNWLTWNKNFQYCNKCGNKLYKMDNLTEKKCSFCYCSFFPNLAPAVMVLIQRNQEVLLARSSYFKPGMYSAIAGFIDIGESAESAAHREVKEEVGVEISRLEYFGSQSWPFPNSFMIAFKAHYLKGECKIDNNEIEDAKWFSLDNLPELPPYPSIARALIDSLKK